MAYYYQQRQPQYTVDIANSVYTSYDVKNNVYVFNVEQGTQFFLKLNGNTVFGEPDVYKNGRELQPSPNGTINVKSDSMGIQRVTTGNGGTYRIKSSNGAEITFQLVITATDGYSQRRQEGTSGQRHDPSWW